MRRLPKYEVHVDGTEITTETIYDSPKIFLIEKNKELEWMNDYTMSYTFDTEDPKIQAALIKIGWNKNDKSCKRKN